MRPALATALTIACVWAAQAQFRPFDNARVRCDESAEMRVILGPEQDLAVVVQRPEGVEQFEGRARRDWSMLSSAGGRLAQYLGRITGREVRQLDVSRVPGTDAFLVFVGRSDWVGDDAALAGIDAHGFVIRSVQDPAGRPALWIAGPGAAGTVFAVNYFLSNYAGVRWVMPGELGEIVPERETVEIPGQIDLIHPGPDFLLRIWSGTAGLDQSIWLADTGATVRFQYHHNLFRIFPPAKYGEHYPDLYPWSEGRRHVPQPDADGNYPNSAWQICFSNPHAPDLAMDYAREVFAANPEMRSISLSVNDSHGYCDCERCRELSGVGAGSGARSYSGAYYRFVNEVARRLKAEFPDKFVAFLPYGMVSAPPDFPLEDNVMMFVFGEPYEILEKWVGAVSRYGYYQWLYGMGWVVSNFWPHAMQDCLQMLYDRGARAFKGEAYCGWGWGGPKLWALANTLWDRDVDIDACLMDYYQHAYGPEAAPAVARFMARWEAIYERRRTDREFLFTRWHPGNWQFEQVTAEDYAALRAHMDAALAAVQGEGNRARLELMLRAFEQGEMVFGEFDTVRSLRQAAADPPEETEPLLAMAAEYHALAPAREQHFRDYIEPARYGSLYFDVNGAMSLATYYSTCGFTYPLRYDEALDGLMGALTDRLLADGTAVEAEAYWNAVADRYPDLAPWAGTQVTLIGADDEPLPNLLTNGSFEEPLADTEAGYGDNWGEYLNRNINGAAARDDSTASDGRFCGTARGAGDYVGFRRSVNLAAGGRYRLSFDYRTDQSTGEARCWFYMNSPRGIWNPQWTLDPADEWTGYGLTFTAPGDEGRVGVTLGLTARRQGDDDQVWFDNARLEELYAPEGG